MLKEAIEKLPSNYLSLEAETIREIIDDNILAEKILALRALCATDYPYKDAHVFNVCALATNNIPVDVSIFHPAELKHIEYMLRLIEKVCKTSKPIELEDEVKNFIVELCKDENIHWFPEEFKLSIVNEDIYKEGITEQAKGAWNKQDEQNIHYVKLKLIEIYCEEMAKKDGLYLSDISKAWG